MIYATTPEFLDQFGLQSRRDLPGIDELKATGLLDPVDDAFEEAMEAGSNSDPDAPDNCGDEADGDDCGEGQANPSALSSGASADQPHGEDTDPENAPSDDIAADAAGPATNAE